MTKVPDHLRQSARLRPDHPAVIEGERVVTYGQLWAEVDRIGEALTRLGVGPRQGIGVLAPNGAGFIAAALAAVGCGATVMPIYHRLAEAELRTMIHGVGLHGVIACDAPSPFLPAATASLDSPLGAMTFHRFATDPNASWIPHVADAAFVRFTSGTTSEARGVVLEHHDVIDRVALAQRGLGLTADDRVVWVLPMAFHLFVSILLYLDVGATIVVCPDHLARVMLETIRRHEATFLYASPMHYRLLAADESGLTIPSLRLAVSVASGLDPAVAQTFRRRYGLPVIQALGVIEVGLPLVNRFDPEGRPAAIGRPTEGCEVAILDAHGLPVANGEVGELRLRCPGMLAAYIDPPLRRDAILRDGWFASGDLARRDADGVITLVGRSKSVLNVAGHKVFPEEVAAVLERHPAVARASVTSRSHPLLGEAIHARIEPAGGEPPDLDSIRAHCRPLLSAHKIPVSIEIVHELELTATGKVRHG